MLSSKCDVLDAVYTILQYLIIHFIDFSSFEFFSEDWGYGEKQAANDGWLFFYRVIFFFGGL